MKPLHLLTTLIFLSALLVGCATMEPISGGDKDITPPVILESSPVNFTTRFSGDVISFRFDEYVVLKDQSTEVVVSPPLKYPLTFKLKGKRLFVTIRDTLLPNTTYNINFGDAIVDLNEGNPLDSNLFVFSTGDVIDSLTISGKVKNAFTLKPEKKAKVLLFRTGVDSAVYNTDPVYLARVDENGHYHLRFLHEGEYEMIALVDENMNNRYDFPETMAFVPHPVNPATVDTINLLTSASEDTSQYVNTYKTLTIESFVVSFNQPVANLVATPLHVDAKTLGLIAEYERPDSIVFWISGKIPEDSLVLHFSDPSGINDTLEFLMKDKKQFFKLLKRKKQNYHVSVTPVLRNGVLDYFDTLRLVFNRPVDKINFDSILFIEGKDTNSISKLVNLSKLQWIMPQKTSGTKYEVRGAFVNYGWQQDTRYALLFLPGAMTDYHGFGNDTLGKSFHTLKFEDYGSLKIALNLGEVASPLILQLLDENGKVLEQHRLKNHDVLKNNLTVPGSYSLRLIIDENDNGRWDPGDITKNRQPELVFYYEENILVRPNWDTEITWNIMVH